MLPVIACAVVLPLTLSRLYRDFSRRNMPFMRLVARDAARLERAGGRARHDAWPGL